MQSMKDLVKLMSGKKMIYRVSAMASYLIILIILQAIYFPRQSTPSWMCITVTA